ncbi:hypothetical protein [Pseudoalteromonas 'SMAR']|uniref:hypothetical protein n=1 Tax=Pseudoalteromonas 'SMAR' TaxID=3416908 RepID=UPI003AF2686D
MKNKAILITVLVLSLVLLSWLPQFNVAMSRFIDEALLQSSVVYAAARAVNGAISLLQSAEVGIGVASIQPAQLLDPINDLVEYISDIMQIAIGSLFIQRMLYTMSTHVLFSVAFTLSALGFLLCLYYQKWQRLSSRLLATMLLVRFVVPFVVLATGLCSQLLLDQEIDKQSQVVSRTVDVFQTQAHTTRAQHTKITAKVNNQKQLHQQQIAELTEQQVLLHGEASELYGDIATIEQQVAAAQANRSLSEWLTFTQTEQAKPLIAKQQQLANEKAKLEAQIALLNQQKDRHLSAIKRLEDELQGDKQGVWSRAIKAVSGGIDELVHSAESLFIDFLNVVSLLLLKLLLMPLLFFYLASKAFKAIWQV